MVKESGIVRLTVLAVGVIILTLLSQLGGIALLVAQCFRRRLLAFLVAYVALSAAAFWIAPAFGRVPLSCGSDGTLRVQGWMFCALNRNYVTPQTAAVLRETADAVDRRYPGTVTLVLDANFPFAKGFPLLPHLSHDDGTKADIALFYRQDGRYLPGKTRSPIGYFAFEDGPSDCPGAWPTLRWNFSALQALWPAYDLDAARTRYILSRLVRDPRVGKIFVEPHLKMRLGLSDEKIRFQGCRAARHDDHIHVQL